MTGAGGEGSPTGRCGSNSPATAPPLENDDLLSDILLRLSPSPSSLPRASLVCKRWRRLISDPSFLRRFRAYHRRNAPLLGFFSHSQSTISFTPTLEHPDRLPQDNFCLELEEGYQILSSRHGLVLIHNPAGRQLLVWEPVTGELTQLAFPPEFGNDANLAIEQAAVLRAAGDAHAGEDHSTPFLLALVGSNKEPITRAFACVYSSETDVWGNLISTACPSMIPIYIIPSTLVGGSLYWLLGPNPVSILEFDLDRQCLRVIDAPLKNCCYEFCRHWVMPSEDGGLGFLCLSAYSAQLWMRKIDSSGTAGWVLGRTVELDKLLSLSLEEGLPPRMVGFAEEDNLSFLIKDIGETDIGVVMIQLESAQIKKILKIKSIGIYHPFASIYTAGMAIGGTHDGAELLHNT